MYKLCLGNTFTRAVKDFDVETLHKIHVNFFFPDVVDALADIPAKSLDQAIEDVETERTLYALVESKDVECGISIGNDLEYVEMRYIQLYMSFERMSVTVEHHTDYQKERFERIVLMMAIIEKGLRKLYATVTGKELPRKTEYEGTEYLQEREIFSQVYMNY